MARSPVADTAPARRAAAGLPPPLVARRLVFVTGKGGVGKTTVAAAIALAASKAGRDTTLCEVGGPKGPAGLLARPRPPRGDGRLAVETLDPDAALREWIARTGGRAAAAVLSRSDVFRYLVAAAPGARELVTIGKAWDLAVQPAGDGSQRLVVVDGPATGHALGLLQAPGTYADMVRVGPIGEQAGAVREFLADPRRSAIVLVATPAEMPVAETLELADGVERVTGRRHDLLVVNQVLPDRFTAAEVARIDRALGSSADPGLRAAATIAERARRRAVEQRAHVRRLRGALPGPLVSLPFLFVRAIGPQELNALSARLAPVVGDP